MSPRYPQIEVELASSNPFALVSAIRQALRHSGAEQGEIHRFTADALEHREPEHIRRVCADWAKIRTS